MKMNIISVLLLTTIIAFSTPNAISQGVVFFGNHPLPGPPFGPDRLVRDADGTPISGTGFVAQLLYQNNGGTWIAHSATASFYDASFALRATGMEAVGPW